MAAVVVGLVVTSRQKGMWGLLMVAGAIALYALLLLVGPHLPWGIQRSLSFIPGVDWTPSALIDAASSVDFRLKVWRMAWRELPKYLWIGRGLLLEDVYQHAWLPMYYYETPEFYYAMHGYHSGPLSLLLDTGVLGLAGFLMIQIGLVLEARRVYRQAREVRHSFLAGVAFALQIRLAVGIAAYYLIFGDIAETLPKLMLSGLLVKLVGFAVQHCEQPEVLRSAPVSSFQPKPVMRIAAPAGALK